MSEQEWLDIFADNLRDIMRENDYTQRELSRLIGISQGYLSKILNKQALPSIKTLVNMSFEFTMTLDELMVFGDRIEY